MRRELETILDDLGEALENKNRAKAFHLFHKLKISNGYIFEDTCKEALDLAKKYQVKTEIKYWTEAHTNAPLRVRPQSF